MKNTIISLNWIPRKEQPLKLLENQQMTERIAKSISMPDGSIVEGHYFFVVDTQNK